MVPYVDGPYDSKGRREHSKRQQWERDIKPLVTPAKKQRVIPDPAAKDRFGNCIEGGEPAIEEANVNASRNLIVYLRLVRTFASSIAISDPDLELLLRNALQRQFVANPLDLTLPCLG